MHLCSFPGVLVYVAKRRAYGPADPGLGRDVGALAAPDVVVPGRQHDGAKSARPGRAIARGDAPVQPQSGRPGATGARRRAHCSRPRGHGRRGQPA